jgi:hypothetical protein
LSHGGTRGVCFVLPTVKKPPDDVIEKSANLAAEFAVKNVKLAGWIMNEEKSDRTPSQDFIFIGIRF